MLPPILREIGRLQAAKFKFAKLESLQWSSVQVCEPRVSGSNPRYSLTTFHSLISLPNGQRLPKLLPYCPQTGLKMLFASEAVVAVSLARSQHIQERI